MDLKSGYNYDYIVSISMISNVPSVLDFSAELNCQPRFESPFIFVHYSIGLYKDLRLNFSFELAG